MRLTYAYDITYHYRCAYCREEYAVRHPMMLAFMEQPLPVPDVPRGWHILDGRLICDAHDFQATIGHEERHQVGA